jgi:hypothetical protein
MIGFVILLLHVLVSPFKTQARLEAEIVLLRHQLSVLRQRVPSRPRLTAADRLLFVWLYRSGIRPAGPSRPSEIIAQGSDIIRIVLAQAGTGRDGVCGRDSECAHSLNSRSQAGHSAARARLGVSYTGHGNKEKPRLLTGAELGRGRLVRPWRLRPASARAKP